MTEDASRHACKIVDASAKLRGGPEILNVSLGKSMAPITDKALSKAAHKEIEAVLACIETIVADGLKHGFFKCSIHAQVGKNGRRELTVESGKSFRFNIPFGEVDR